MYSQKFKHHPKIAKLLKEFEWQTSKQLFNFIATLNNKKFDESGIFKKEEFTTALYKQMDECEGFANTLIDIRDTLGREFIELSFSNDYGYLMVQYKKERKKLRNLLSVLNLIANRKSTKNKNV
jgi:hypothetical protein